MSSNLLTPPSADTTLALRLRNLGKSYPQFDKPAHRLTHSLFGTQPTRDFWALQNLSLDLPQHHTLGIVGRNGSGKSTLLQLLAGTLAPTTGALETHGKIAALLELGAGFHPDFSGRENVYLNARILGLSKDQTDARFDQIAAFADIGNFLDAPVKTYSSGMFLRLAFAVIAHVDADLLIIDEALAVGDAFFTQKCMRFLRAFKERGTILLVSHDASAILSLCDTVLWLDAGRPRQIGPAKAVHEAYLADLFADLNQQRSPSEPAAPTPQPLLASSDSFGQGGARILAVDLRDLGPTGTSNPTPTTLATPNHLLRLRIHFQTLQPLASPIVGFYLKDRLGQNLFGHNTASLPAHPLATGEKRIASFDFLMPTLQPGAYTITAAIADGTLDHHVQHHWIHDALALAAPASPAAIGAGLVGIPMRSVAYSPMETAP